MTYLSMKSRTPKQQPELRKQSKPADAAFDLWLTRGLHKLYDDVANEPIPAELLKLIQEDRKK